jgi:hypothetical protein
MYAADQRDKILDWYSPLNFFLRQADIFNTWQPGTGGWLLAEALFKEWKSGGRKILWCRGIREYPQAFHLMRER